MIKKHNFPGNAPEQQIQSTQPCLKQLQEIYENKAKRATSKMDTTRTGKRERKENPYQRTKQKPQLKTATKTPKKAAPRKPQQHMRENEKGQLVTIKPEEMAKIKIIKENI